MSSAPIAPVDLATTLAGIRRLTDSKLSHQAKPAQLLAAIEDTLKVTLTNEVGPPYSATAYFASLNSCLNKAVASEKDAKDFSEGGLIPATLYLLAAVTQDTPKQVVVNQLPSLLPTLLGLFEPCLGRPPALRSLIQVFSTIFLLCPASTLSSSPLLKKAFNHFLELNLDPRPKVRHLAQEGVRKALTTPIPPKMVAGDHPYLQRARDWVTTILTEEVEGGKSQSKAKKVKFSGANGTLMAGAEDVEGKRAIWVVQGLRGWISVWGEDGLAELCPLLLSLPPSPHLTPQIYSLLSLLLSPPPNSEGFVALANLPIIINALLSSPPPPTSPADQVEYIDALVAGMIKLYRQDEFICTKEYFAKAWTVLWSSILVQPTTSPEARRKAAEGLGNQGLIRYCISPELIKQAVDYKFQGGDLDSKRQKMKPPMLTKLIAQIEKAMATQPLMLPYLLPILAALVSKMRAHKGEAAKTLLLEMVVSIADLRVQPGFQEKEKVDEVVGMAFEVLGVEAVLSALPLNVSPDASGRPPQPGRAHLLPLMRAHISNDSLGYFVSNLVPLSEKLFTLKVKAEEGGRAAEAKVWEVVIGQIWSCLPGFLDLARDVRTAFNSQFAQLLSQILYSQPLLRPSVLRALSNLITSTQTAAKSAAPSEELIAGFGIDQQDAAQTLTYLKTMANEMLAVLFNVFSTVGKEQRGSVGDVIGLWLSVMGEEDISNTYTKVATHLGTALSDPSAKEVSHAMLDLLIILVPHLPRETAQRLFTAASTGDLLENADPAVQKKSYRILTRSLELQKATFEGDAIDLFVGKIAAAGRKIGVGAQRDRLMLLTALVPVLPKSRLHLIPTLITEAVLSTKEVNEKARNAAFDLLVVMANKMAEGGTIQQSLLNASGEEGMGEEEQPAEDASASIPEYITMVAAGLAGNTPHMISASITALARLMFEYQKSIPAEMLNELIATIVVFVASKNREVVKSALGFVKVAVVALPEETMRPHLPGLVPALLGWVHDHKNHFKLKTVHIFERMIRKFGYQDVYSQAGDGDAKKVLEHIKKKKDRAKRQKIAKATSQADEVDDDDAPRRAASGNAFEDALYGSASEDESEDDDMRAPAAKTSRQVKGKAADRATAFIQEDEGVPMDLLDRSIAGKVTRFDPNDSKKRRLPGQDAGKFKTDQDTGRMIIEESEDEEAPAAAPSTEDRLAGSAYQVARTAVDGMVRDARGNVKFNKNTKRGRALEQENDVDMLEGIMDDDSSRKKPKSGKKAEKLGSEYRSKRAGGDVKKQGQADPYSYVPLNKAGKQKGATQKVNLTNKKRGSRNI